MERVVAGRFKIDALIGEGGMGSVWRGLDTTNGQPVAVKLVRADASSDTAHRRFLREAAVLASLSHPAIVRFVSTGLDRGEPYLAMEWVEGESLEARLARAALSAEETIALGCGVARGLAAAHANDVVHRDIKPANILLASGDPAQPKIVDFGIAFRHSETSKLTRAGGIVGTLSYLAPEQVRGEVVGPAADVFSLACVLWECLCRRPAFTAHEPFAILLKILAEEPSGVEELSRVASPELQSVLKRMLAKAATDRPADGTTALRLLEGVSSVVPLGKGTRSLTDREARVVSVVLVTQPLSEVNAQAATVVIDSDSRLAGLVPAAERCGARAEVLRDGTLLAYLEGSETATEQAAIATRLARSLARTAPECIVVVATGRGELSGGGAATRVLDKAATLLAGAKAGRVRTDGLTAELLQEDDLESLDVVGESSPRPRYRTPFVGRRKELNRFASMVLSCWDDSSALPVFLCAPSGTGKSRFAAELATRVTEDDPNSRAWSVRCDPLLEKGKLTLLATLIGKAMGLLASSPLDERCALIRTQVAASEAPGSEETSEFLCELLASPVPETGSSPLRAARENPVLMSDQMQRAASSFLRARARHAPLMIVVDDVQWADADSVRVLRDLCREDVPVALFMTGTPEGEAPLLETWGESGLDVVRLSPLPSAERERIVMNSLGTAVSADRAKHLAERCQGNLTLLQEMTRLETYGVQQTTNSLVTIIQVRLEALDAPARRVLRAASIFGRSFWPEAVDRLVGGASVLDRALTDLERRGWIVADADNRFGGASRQYSFVQPIVHDASYSMLTDEDRRTGHAVAAEWLLERGESDPFVLAEHFARSDTRERAVPYYSRAADLALARNDMPTCLELGDRAVKCGAAGELLAEIRRNQAEACHWTGDATRTVSHGLEALGGLPFASAKWYSAARLVATGGVRGGDASLVTRMAAVVRTQPRDAAAAIAQAMAAARIATSLHLVGEHAQAAPLLELTERFLRECSVPWPAIAATLHDARARAALHASQLNAHVQERARAAAAFDEAGNRRAACVARLNLAFGLMTLGRFPAARAELEEGRVVAEQLGVSSAILAADHMLGLVLLRLGRLEEARSTEQRAISRAVTVGDTRMEGASRGYMAMIERARGGLDEAEVQARKAVELLENIRPVRPAAEAVLAELLLAKSRAAEALEVAERAHSTIESGVRLEEGEALVHLVFAKALTATGCEQRAREVLSSAIADIASRTGELDPNQRGAYLDIPEHRGIWELAAQLGMPVDWSGTGASGT